MYLNLVCNIRRHITYNKIPEINILEDCCVDPPQKCNIDTIVLLTPFKLVNVGFEELKYANRKLAQLDDAIRKQLDSPYAVTDSRHW